MRARLLWLVLVIGLGGLVGLLITRDPGYVLLAYDHMALETSLWFALLLLALAYLVLRLLLVIVFGIARGRGRISRWRIDRQARTADQQILAGLAELAGGRFAAARKQLGRGAARAGSPALNLIGAAQAAAGMGDREGRDALLAEARTLVPDALDTIDFAAATLELEAGELAAARATLAGLRARRPDHSQALWLLAQCCRELGDWQALGELLAPLRRDRSRSREAVDVLERAAIAGRLVASGEQPAAVWATVPKTMRQDPELVVAYARRLDAAGDHDAAEQVVRELLGRHWDPRLVECYGRIAASDSPRQLRTAEGWQRAHPDDPVLELALGRLALREGHWSDARTHLEASIALAPTPAALGELGRLRLALGDPGGSELLLAALPDLLEVSLPVAVPVAGGTEPER